MSWDNEDIFKFIELYKLNPCIWDPRNENYKDKNKVNEAWIQISNIMEISVTDLKKKKETLMSAFRLHLKKKRASIFSGCSENEVYKPCWIFYSVLESFLGDIYHDDSKLMSEIKQQLLTKGDDGIEEKEIKPRKSSSLCPEIQRNCKYMKTSKTQRNGFSCENDHDSEPELESNKIIKLAFESLNNTINNKRLNEEYDECELYGKLISKKLKQFSVHERQEIMYEIDGLLINRSRSQFHNQPIAYVTTVTTLPGDEISPPVKLSPKS